MNEKIIIALIGVLGAIIGSISTVAVQFLKYKLEQKEKKKRDQPRKELLKEMLLDERFEWRKFETLKHVIGSDDDTTKRLLLEIGARASEDGQNLWGLKSRNPLQKVEQ